jgi:hypothetical protein
MKYRVYFQIYGRKMVTEIEAKNEIDAKKKVNEMLKFDKIEPFFTQDNSEFINIMDMLINKK